MSVDYQALALDLRDQVFTFTPKEGTNQASTPAEGGSCMQHVRESAGLAQQRQSGGHGEVNEHWVYGLVSC